MGNNTILDVRNRKTPPSIENPFICESDTTENCKQNRSESDEAAILKWLMCLGVQHNHVCKGLYHTNTSCSQKEKKNPTQAKD